MLADEVDYVVGVDTHRDEHVLAAVAAPSGAVVAQQAVRASARGYAQSLRFVEQHSSGRRVWAVEGAGHYGAGLARHLSGRGETVLEIGRGPRDERRLRGKDDSLDAIRAARIALASEALSLPRAGQRREALRLLLLARRSAVDVRREALVQLRSVIVTCPDRLREQLRGLPAGRLILRCSRLRRPSSCTPDEFASRLVLRSLACERSSNPAARDHRKRQHVGWLSV
jgi:transposase